MHPLRRGYLWMRDRPLVCDLLIAGVVTLVGLVTELITPGAEGDLDGFAGSTALSIALSLLATLSLLWRRRYPFTVVVVTSVALVAHVFSGSWGVGPTVALLLAIYAAAAYGARRAADVALGVTAVALLVVFFRSPVEVHPASVVFNLAIYGAAWVFGDNSRMRRNHIADVEQWAGKLERERDEQAQKAVEEERSRIARELHDIVAHNMSVMVVQAGAARRTIDRDPAAASEAMAAIESTGRSALNEMRHMLGVLRESAAGQAQAASVSLEPQPDLDDLRPLVDGCRAAGLDVELVVRGHERPLPPGVQLTVFRIVQEALTNSMKHAGPATAQVKMDYGHEFLTVEVVDDGRGASTGSDGAGHGISGMRERVVVFGGNLEVGPRVGGGYRVRAELPIEAA